MQGKGFQNCRIYKNYLIAFLKIAGPSQNPRSIPCQYKNGIAWAFIKYIELKSISILLKTTGSRNRR